MDQAQGAAPEQPGSPPKVGGGPGWWSVGMQRPEGPRQNEHVLTIRMATRLARAFSPFLLEGTVVLGLRPLSADFDLGCFSAALQA